jgi:hypothetical protein
MTTTATRSRTSTADQPEHRGAAERVFVRGAAAVEQCAAEGEGEWVFVVVRRGGAVFHGARRISRKSNGFQGDRPESAADEDDSRTSVAVAARARRPESAAPWKTWAMRWCSRARVGCRRIDPVADAAHAAASSPALVGPRRDVVVPRGRRCAARRPRREIQRDGKPASEVVGTKIVRTHSRTAAVWRPGWRRRRRRSRPNADEP